MTIILGDIGGTNARLAYADSTKGPLRKAKIFNCKDFDSIDELLSNYCGDEGIKPILMSLAVAGPVLDDMVKLTNGNWEFSKRKLEETFNLHKAIFMNDFTAQAYAQIPFFSKEYDIQNWKKDRKAPIGRFHKGTSNQVGPLLVLGPGTGLGVATLVFGTNEKFVLQGEGGQVHFTPRNQIEAELYLWLLGKTKNVSAEEVVSGRGLENIYRFLLERQKAPTRNKCCGSYSAEEIGDAALRGEKDAVKAVKLMFGILGTVAANGVLTNGSWGGVVIAGGITPKLIDLFNISPFLDNFSSHEVYQALLERVSVYIFSDPLGGLKGAQIGFREISSKQNFEKPNQNS